MDFKIPFSGRGHLYTQEEIETVAKVMNEEISLTQGKYLQAFEQAFESKIGVSRAFAVNTATSGLEIVAQLCQFQEGDEVIIPGHTFTASAYPFVKKGAKIVWADIDLDTRVADVAQIEQKLSSKTKAIIVVHLYGYVANMPAIMNLAKQHNLIVIEDAAQAIGCELEGKKAGAFGDFGIFSFHSHKNITTLGEGGILAANNRAYADVIPMLRHNGHCGFDFEREHYWLPAMGNVDLPELNGEHLMPNNYCLGEVECALGVKLLERLDEINDRKRDRALSFIDELKPYSDLISFHRVKTRRHNYHLLAAKMAPGKRDLFMEKMSSEKGVQCVVQYYPLYRYDLYKKLGLGEADCPNCDAFFDNMVSFPFQQWLGDDELAYMLQSTKEVLDEIRD